MGQKLEGAAPPKSSGLFFGVSLGSFSTPGSTPLALATSLNFAFVGQRRHHAIQPLPPQKPLYHHHAHRGLKSPHIKESVPLPASFSAERLVKCSYGHFGYAGAKTHFTPSSWWQTLLPARLLTHNCGESAGTNACVSRPQPFPGFLPRLRVTCHLPRAARKSSLLRSR